MRETLFYLTQYVAVDTEAIEFLETAAAKPQASEGSLEPYLLLKSVIAQLKLKDKHILEECKKALEHVQERLDGVAGVDPSVYSNFYRAQAEYHKVALFSSSLRD